VSDRKDTEALKQLSDIEELVYVPPERGGVYLSDWERSFVHSLIKGGVIEFTAGQREKIAEIWHVIDLRKRSYPEEKVANLFSNLSPERQKEQRERAARVKLPWET
jgi:hypothetical protein